MPSRFRNTFLLPLRSSYFSKNSSRHTIMENRPILTSRSIFEVLPARVDRSRGSCLKACATDPSTRARENPAISVALRSLPLPVHQRDLPTSTFHHALLQFAGKEQDQFRSRPVWW